VKKVCAWCGKDLGDVAPYTNQDTTHGLCPQCHLELLKKDLVVLIDKADKEILRVYRVFYCGDLLVLNRITIRQDLARMKHWLENDKEPPPSHAWHGVIAEIDKISTTNLYKPMQGELLIKKILAVKKAWEEIGG